GTLTSPVSDHWRCYSAYLASWSRQAETVVML
ncbi:hypothetical protein H257_13171, partial [Aphanomyces astaci]